LLNDTAGFLIRRCAEELGYLVEDFWLSDPQLNPRRLTRVLQARGIQGLILPGPHPHLDLLDWFRFAAATTHAVLPWPLHRVGHDALHGSRLAFTRLRERGYRRIGLMLHESHDLTSGGVERAAYLLETAALPSAQRTPILMVPRHSAIAPRTLFDEWVRRRQPDAVLCSDESVLGWTRELGLEVPARLALASLGRHPHLTQWAGIDMYEDRIGAAAVDLVVGQLNSGELGVPPFQKDWQPPYSPASRGSQGSSAGARAGGGVMVSGVPPAQASTSGMVTIAKEVWTA